MLRRLAAVLALTIGLSLSTTVPSHAAINSGGFSIGNSDPVEVAFKCRTRSMANKLYYVSRGYRLGATEWACISDGDRYKHRFYYYYQ